MVLHIGISFRLTQTLSKGEGFDAKRLNFLALSPSPFLERGWGEANNGQH
jgi:hypothetical protein